jgi:hypothetical protein
VKATADNAMWMRIRERYPNATLFGTKIQPNDIRQGELGDCYFLSAIAAFAEWPSRI